MSVPQAAEPALQQLLGKAVSTPFLLADRKAELINAAKALLAGGAGALTAGGNGTAAADARPLAALGAHMLNVSLPELPDVGKVGPLLFTGQACSEEPEQAGGLRVTLPLLLL
jgi:hypothetical protein